MPDRSALYRVDRQTVLTPRELNKRFLDINSRILGIEVPRMAEDEAFTVVLDRVLSRSEQVIAGMRAQLLAITQLEWLTATSDTSITLVEEADRALIIPEAQRALFSPGPFAVLTRATAPEDYAIVRTLAFDRASGQWDIRIEAFYGDDGPFDDWLISAIAGSTLAQYSMLDEGREARDLAVDAKAVIVPLAAQIDADAAAIEAARIEIDADAAAAELARQQSVAAKDLSVAAGAAGRQALYWSADNMRARPTNGPSFSSIELPTNKIVVTSWDFSPSSYEYVQWTMGLPKSYDLGTITFRPRWKRATSGGADGVCWALRAVAISDNEALDVAMGAPQLSIDNGATANRGYRGAESPPITIAGPPAAEDQVQFELYRVTDNAGDTLPEDACLTGVDIWINTTSGTDA